MNLIFILGAIAFIAVIAFAISQTSRYRGLKFGVELTYDDATTTGIRDNQVNVQYDDRIYDDRQLKGRLLYLIDMMSSSEAKTSIQRAFDRTMLKDIISLAVSKDSSVTAGEEIEINIGANKKDNVIEHQLLEFGFIPTGSGYTNMGIVSDKATSNTSTIKIKPYDPAKKFGIAAGQAVPADTIISIIATANQAWQGSPDPISAQPRVIENYVQIMRSPYAYDDIVAKENLYTKGTIKADLDAMAKDFMLLYGEKMLLSESPGYYKKTARLGSSDDKVQLGIMRGLVHMLKYGDITNGIVSPAVKSYTTWDYNVFDNWQWALFDPDLDDIAEVRLLVCNKAMRKFFTDLIQQKRAYWEPTDAYGMKGIRTIYTDAGQFDLMVHPRVHARYPDMDKPFGMALTLPFIEYKPMIKPYLAANIQPVDYMGKKSEYRWAWTFLLHNIGTAYHGIVYPI